MGNLELYLQKNPELPEIAKIIMKRALPEPLVVILDLVVCHLFPSHSSQGSWYVIGICSREIWGQSPVCQCNFRAKNVDNVENI